MPTDKSTNSRKPKPSPAKDDKLPLKTALRKSRTKTPLSPLSNRVAELQELNAADQTAVLADQKRRGVSWLDEIEGCFEGDPVFAKICELGAAIRRADRPKG